MMVVSHDFIDLHRQFEGRIFGLVWACRPLGM